MANDTCWDKDANLQCAHRLKYMSDYRVQLVRRQQMTVMAEMNVTVLDVYQGSYLSAHQHEPGDSVHYQPEFSQVMLNWFYAEQQNFTGAAPGY
jgi:hypothetical protein